VASVQYEEATRLYPGTPKPAVNKLDLTVADGELLVLVGPSGSGKSTALRMLAGLEPLDDGRILIGGNDVSSVRPRDRDIAMVFQNYALYPNLDVAQNMGFALKQQGVPKEERTKRVREVAKLRVQTRAELVELQTRLAVTTVYVTHDQVEAMTMGDRVAVLRDGELQQCDAPSTLYHAPANLFVAGFIGSPPAKNAPVTLDGSVKIAGAEIRIAEAFGGERATIGFRPEAVLIGAEGPIPARIRVVEDLGSEVFVHLVIDHEGEERRIVAKVDPPFAGEPDENVRLTLRGAVHLFDATEVRRATVTL